MGGEGVEWVGKGVGGKGWVWKGGGRKGRRPEPGGSELFVIHF
jgi:hypothetical protein